MWEDIVGYSRAVRTGNVIEVSGTIALDKHGESVAVGDPYRQTIQIISIARKVESLSMIYDNGSGFRGWMCWSTRPSSQCCG